jgi:hypothetical protein
MSELAINKGILPVPKEKYEYHYNREAGRILSMLKWEATSACSIRKVFRSEKKSPI